MKNFLKLIIASTLMFMANSSDAGKKIEVQGHRGARWVRPENTIPAFLYALEHGVDTLEMDMLVTSDGHIIIAHDPYLNPAICLDEHGSTISRKLAVRSLTKDQVQKYDCGSITNPRFPEQKVIPKTKIPTLEEVLDAVSKSDFANANRVLFNIETKIEPEHPKLAPTPEEFVKLFLAVVKAYHLENRVTLQSFDYRTLKIARALEPKLSLSALVEDRPKSTEALVQLAKDNQVQIISPYFEWLTKQDVEALHKIGVRVIPWTPNRERDWQKLIEIGVDGIITDNPKALIDFLKSKGWL